MPWEDIWPLLVAVTGAAVGLLLVELVYRPVRWLARGLRRKVERTPATDEIRDRATAAFGRGQEALVERLYRPVQLLLAVGGALVAVAVANTSDADLDALQDGLVIGIVIAGVWLAVVVLLLLVGAVGGSGIAGSDMGRRFRSQVDTLARVLSIVVALAVLVAALYAVDQARSLGTTVLAGAGVVGVIGGFAAQQTLSNLFAGIAIGFNDKLNVGDFIEVEGQSGEIVQRTLSYVAVKLSDERTLVLPSSLFLGTAHTDWRLTRRRIVGWVPLAVDWGVSVADLQRALRAAYKKHGFGDDTDLTVEVVDVTEAAVRVRAKVRARPDDLWTVQCTIREELVRWVDDHAEARPRLRADVTTADGGDDGSASSSSVPVQHGAGAKKSGPAPRSGPKLKKD